MDFRRDAGPWGVAFAIALSASACRQLNPGFFLEDQQATTQQASPENTHPVRDPQESSTTGNNESTPEPTGPAEPQTTTGEPTSTETQTTSFSSSHTTSTTASSSTSSTGTESGTTSANIITHWDTQFPLPDPNASATDHCLHGSKGCFVFADFQARSLESVTPGYPGIFLDISNGQAPSSSAGANAAKSPLDKGLRIDGANTHIESRFPYPRLEGQGFGIEIWYRSDPNPNYTGDKPAMLVQVPSNIWMEEAVSNGGIACGAWSTKSPWTRALHGYQVGPNAEPDQAGRPRDQLRVAACILSQNQLHVFSNGKLTSEFKNQSEGQFRVHANIIDRTIAVGGWVNGNDAAKSHQPFYGTVYMLRFWNNINYMKHAMVRDLNAHGLRAYTAAVQSIPE